MIKVFSSALRDPTTGAARPVTIEVHGQALLVRLGQAMPKGEDAPHHATADFTAQRAEIVAALGEAKGIVHRDLNAAAAGIKAERERVERLIAKWAPLSNGVDDRLLADIRSGATS